MDGMNRFDTKSGNEEVQAPDERPLLSVRNLKTWFRTDSGVARAVDGVSFDLHRGETLGIVGESGSGKSVSSLSVMRLIPDPPGEILPESQIMFDGDSGPEDLVRVSEERMRQIRGNEIAMIFQEPMTALNPVFTVGRQIMEAVQLHQGLEKSEAREKAIELLHLVGIPIPHQRVDEYPHQLSGGMRQRVMIAMALACDPKLLIADEPTTALDVTIQAQILDLLNRLQEELGMSIILITHDLGVVAETCDRMVVMYAGQVCETGPVGEVFRNPQHPYTEGLLNSIPRLGQKADRLNVIPGTVPSPEEWPSGCRFHPRCPYAWETCRSGEVPEVVTGPAGGIRGDAEVSGDTSGTVGEEPAAVGTGRRVRCWLPKHPERRRVRIEEERDES